MTMKKMLICMSGGRTSAYMTELLLANKSSEYEFLVCFANTGWEHDKTLEFVHNCDLMWQVKYGQSVNWLEADVKHGEKVSSSYSLVTYETASRKQEPFEEVVKKYGIPNKGYPHCTRELKENPIIAFAQSHGWEHGRKLKSGNVDATYETAIGIRTDEPKRIKRGWSRQNKVYPLVDWFPTDKLDVLDFWEDQPFDLGIPEHLGNCVGCFKKSNRKLLQVMRDEGERAFEFPAAIEVFYGHVGPNKIGGVFSKEPRTMYRERLRVPDLIALFRDSEFSPRPDDQEAESGCASSCEPFTSD